MLATLGLEKRQGARYLLERPKFRMMDYILLCEPSRTGQLNRATHHGLLWDDPLGDLRAVGSHIRDHSGRAHADGRGAVSLPSDEAFIAVLRVRPVLEPECLEVGS